MVFWHVNMPQQLLSNNHPIHLLNDEVRDCTQCVCRIGGAGGDYKQSCCVAAAWIIRNPFIIAESDLRICQRRTSRASTCTVSHRVAGQLATFFRYFDKRSALSVGRAYHAVDTEACVCGDVFISLSGVQHSFSKVPRGFIAPRLDQARLYRRSEAVLHRMEVWGLTMCLHRYLGNLLSNLG